MIPGGDWGAAAMAHAQRTYPHESCGVVMRGQYRELMNDAADPAQDFDCTAQLLDLMSDGEDIQALIHSHPNGRDHPTETDMRQQLEWVFPWGLVPFIGDRAQPPFLWGGKVADNVPFEGRGFRWGPTGTDGKGDCAALVRDYYWTTFGIGLREYPRDDGWVRTGLRYREALLGTGFIEFPGVPDPMQGDVILFRVRSTGGNHAGIYIDPGMVLHHQEGRISRAEPLLLHIRHVTGWFRHVHRVANASDPARQTA